MLYKELQYQENIDNQNSSSPGIAKRFANAWTSDRSKEAAAFTPASQSTNVLNSAKRAAPVALVLDASIIRKEFSVNKN